MESSSSRSKWGKKIEAGNKAIRLVIQGLEGDSRFAIEIIQKVGEDTALKPSEKFIFQNERGIEVIHIELEGVGILEVGLQELARRLHLSTKELKQAEKDRSQSVCRKKWVDLFQSMT